MGINALFGLCTAPYIVSAEDDWELIATENIFSRAIHVLKYRTQRHIEPKLIGIYMGHSAFYEKENDEVADEVVYRVINSGDGWCFGNGGTFLSKEALLDVGPQMFALGDIAEMMYKTRVWQKGYRMGSLIRENGTFMRGFEHRGDHITEVIGH